MERLAGEGSDLRSEQSRLTALPWAQGAYSYTARDSPMYICSFTTTPYFIHLEDSFGVQPLPNDGNG